MYSAFLAAIIAIVVSFIVIASSRRSRDSRSGTNKRPRAQSESPEPIPYPTTTSRALPSPPSPSTPMALATSGRFDEARRAELKRIAEETIAAIKEGRYAFRGVDQDLSVKTRDAIKNTIFFEPDSAVSLWASTKPDAVPPPQSPTHIAVLNISTLDAARLLEHAYMTNPLEEHSTRTGVLNFASATKPGGGFKNGAEAQEESIARASTLYFSLNKSEEAAKFYKLHRAESAQNAAAYYSHAIIYSPKVTVFRDDDGEWTYPFDVDVLSCAAVNAGELKKSLNGPISSGLDVFVEKEMGERMGRILYVFEQHNIRNIVLGTFGTGVFRNSVATVARIWAQLLILPDARFKYSFDRIIFAITGGETFADFQSAFDAWGQHRAPGLRGA
ncbi:hypothetical protein JR316_0010933 [Psilocybe cubensis]|uniref:Uncharacterized protein n=2 Tax=Psilocybe cubensis TaxID=181762 RepID=A0ACB8GNP2_PSICU|nr:hypothetical protein JR316_0010933 [Psilocybe cubensis]KAH9477017.1 hypothetical protein JR316_0010933 [Psilocybe cubensis]